jgi:flagella basal body P-ring formation protein FlgA
MMLALLVLALSGAGPQPVEPQAKPPAPRGVETCAQVSGDTIRVSDLTAVAPTLATLPPDEVVGYTPAPGVRRLITRQELVRLAERHGVHLEAGAGACVERSSVRLSKERLEAALRAALKEAASSGAPEPRVEVLEFSRYPVPEGELEFARSGLPTPPRTGTAVVWRGHVRYGGNRSVPVWARIKLAVSGKGLVAVESLPAGRPVRAEQVRLASLEWFPLSETPAQGAGLVVGRVPRRAIPAGAPILAAALTQAQQIERGDTVTVDVSSGAAQLRFEARAETSGSAGESVLLRNPSNGRTFSGRVEAKGRVTVDANALQRPARAVAVGRGGTRAAGRQQ